MMNFILAPLGILLMVLGVIGLFVALRGPEHLRSRLSNLARRSAKDAGAPDDE
jgi:hypothetical protein